LIFRRCFWHFFSFFSYVFVNVVGGGDGGGDGGDSERKNEIGATAAHARGQFSGLLAAGPAASLVHRFDVIKRAFGGDVTKVCAVGVLFVVLRVFDSQLRDLLFLVFLLSIFVIVIFCCCVVTVCLVGVSLLL
jgi:hypothetical protein